MKPNTTPPASFRRRNIISMRDFSKQDILSFLDFTDAVRENPSKYSLNGLLMASCFFEPSTRTRLSFEAAMKRLNGEVIGFSDAQSSSVSKHESLYDTIKIVGQYSDLIVIRHPLDGAAALAANATDKPVINAGDGSNQHPTQTLLDLYAIRETQKSLENLHIAFSGDLKYGRTAHSLVQAASHFNTRIYFAPLKGLELPTQITDELKQRGVLFSFHEKLDDIIPKLDILYMTRVQEERIPDDKGYLKPKGYTLTKEMLKQAKPTLKILHPLPRIKEIDLEVDQTPYAFYFQQAHYGLFVRQALLLAIMEAL